MSRVMTQVMSRTSSMFMIIMITCTLIFVAGFHREAHNLIIEMKTECEHQHQHIILLISYDMRALVGHL